MPRVIRDSDEEVETKSSTRRTRASAVSSTSVTDSPRRTTRSNKQLTTIESSPESLDDSNAQPRGRATRSRAATLDKSAAAGVAKNLRSRKNSVSSNASETIDLESEPTKKRVTRKAAATATAVGTPTKASQRTRNLRAGSEAKSTSPVSRSTRVTRASSVDPVNTPIESVGTPVRRRTRVSIVPAQETVTEEEEAKNQTPESVNNTVVEIDEDSDNESVSTKGKSNKKVAKNRKEKGKDNSTAPLNLDTSKTNEENMCDKSCTSNDSNGDSTLKELTTHSITSELESFTSIKTDNSEKIDPMPISETLVSLTDQNLIKSHSDSNENNSDSVKTKVDINDDECENIDVENFTLTDDSIDVINSPKKVDTLTLDIKDSYVKLDRTNLVEKIVVEKLEESKSNDNDLFAKLNDKDSVSQNNVITNAKTAIVLVNDFVKSNEYFKNMEDQQIFDSGISLNNKEDKSYNTSAHNSDDQMSIVSVDDNDEVLSLKLFSPTKDEIKNEKLIIEALPDDEKNNFNKLTDESVSVNVNNDNVHNFSSEKADVCLKENEPESKLKSENLIGEKNKENNNLENVDTLVNVVDSNDVEIVGEIGDGMISENTNKVDCFETMNALGDNAAISNSLRDNVQPGDSVSMDVDEDTIVSINAKSPVVEINLTATECEDDVGKEVAEPSEIEIVCEISNTDRKISSDENMIIETNDSASLNDIEIEVQQSISVNETNGQLEQTDPSKSESNPKENHDISKPCVINETSSNELEPKVSLEDKNAVPSAVTDADGDSAFSPIKEEETHETSTDTTSNKSPEKSKRKPTARLIDSDLDESAEDLFQDIPAEEWSEEQSKRKSNGLKRTSDAGNSSVKLDDDSVNEDKSVDKESDDREDAGSKGNKSRKSINEKELDNSLLEITNVANGTVTQQADVSLSKKGRKSVEKKRESGQSSDSGIQDSNKTIVENDADESDSEMNESRSKPRRSSVHDKNDSVAEKLSKSLVDQKFLNKSSKSLNSSSQFNVSVFDNFRKQNDSLSTFLNASNTSRRQSLIDSRKSIAEKQIKEKENSETEAMEVDEVCDSDSEINKPSDSPNKSRKSPNKNESVAEKSLNASKIEKRLSLNKSLNKSSRKSSVEPIQAEEVVDNDIEVDSNKSMKEAVANKSLFKSQNFFNESSGRNDGLSENVLSTSLNESKKSKKRLSEKLNESTRKSLIKEQNEEKESEVEEMDVDVVNEKSPNKSRRSLEEPSSNKSLNKSLNKKEKASAKAEAEVSLSNGNKSLKEKSSRKSASKSLISSTSDVIVDDDSESDEETNEGDQQKNTSKALIISSKSLRKSSDVKDAEDTDVSITESTPEKKKGGKVNTSSSGLDHSLQKSIERMKFTNPPKHEISTVVQVHSSSDEDYSYGRPIRNFIFHLADGEEMKDSSDEEEKEENHVDSDIEREYNLGGKSISKYSDDDVPGDDCRVSEEESSDHEDDGTDLEDFVVPDEEVEDEDDSDDDEDEEDEDEDAGEDANMDADEDGDENEDAKIQCAKENKINLSKKNVSVNSMQSTLKNASSLRRSGFSQSSGSESDDEVTEAENRNGNGRLNNSETIEGKNISLQKKDKSIDSSSESDDDAIPNESQVKAKDKSLNVSAKNKSLNVSAKNKSLNLSKSTKDKNASLIAKKLNDSKADKSKRVRMEVNDQTASSSSESDDDDKNESMKIVSPSETESESEEGEDFYHIVNIESRDTSLLKPKNKKLIDCSTPKPGVAKKTDFSKDSLSMTASRRKSGSLNDLSDTKLISSRLSIGDAASKSMKLGDTSMKLKDDVEIVATPDTVGKTRQAWKLIPLNQTAHPSVEDTPGTKFLKKSKLNDSVPAVLESMKSANVSSSSAKKSKKVELEEFAPPKELKKSKKRKLLDMSNAQSVDEDSILKVSKKNKKRARFDESTVEQQEQAESIEQSSEEVPVSKKAKKKKNKAKEVEVDDVAKVEDAPEEVDQKTLKKRKKKQLNAQEADEEVETVELEKPKKKKSKVIEAKPVESQGSKNKKSKKQVADNSDDEAPESVGLEEARRRVLNELEGVIAAKESLKKKQKDQADRARKEKPTKSLKRLPEDILDSLTDEPLRRPDKRQKLSRNKERSIIMPSKSMFSPGKVIPENLRVDDGYIPLSSAGGTTQFAVVKLQKAKKKVDKASAIVFSFREKMIARNARMPAPMYLSYMKEQKAKGRM